MSAPLSARQLWILIANSDLTGNNPASALSIAWPALKLRECEERLRADLLCLVESGHVEICFVGPGVPRGPWPRSAPIPRSVLQGAVLGEGSTRLPQTWPAPTIACTGLGIEAVDFLQAGEDGDSVGPLWEDETRAHIRALHADLDILASNAGGLIRRQAR